MLNDSTTISTANVVKEIDEDAILGDDDDSSFNKPDESLLHNEDLLLSETNLIETPNITSQQVATEITSASVVVPISKPISQESSVQPISKPTNTVSSLKKLASSNISTLTPEEKKQARLLKFSDPKVKNRAERFGVITPADPELTEDSKLKQRIQRFGEVVSTKAKNLNEKERFEKRKERFGIVNVGDTKSNGNKMNQFNKPVQNESIKKRQDRFGVVENAKPQNKILPGFKRRRFAY
ncbi:hypothetical protein RDWZM_004842 [Blomia tropicalis]|uniref:THO1-MOS11 C-terminal domain-containing protein n=1 Tax=Blomia tropicalis TaxID=40697 RepID=A0A9Q0M4L5_BLOTA|nr:hypothetical protein RDWZM_004842 [Blomia tropicalis]